MNVCDAGRHAGTQRHEKGLTFNKSGGFYENYYSKPIVSFEISNSLEIAYDMKNMFLAMYYLFPPQTTECKNNSYVHSNKF